MADPVDPQLSGDETEEDKDGNTYTASDFMEMDGRYEYVITEFSKKRELAKSKPKQYSEVFSIKGYKWRLLFFPLGNANGNSSRKDFFSVYLDVGDQKELPMGWHRHAKFNLILKNRAGKGDNHRDASHTFQARECDWGFTQFVRFEDLLDPEAGYLENDEFTIIVETKVIKDYVQASNRPFMSDYDTKKETGFVGIKNQGATCYMNSLLQALFHLNYFRRAVYKMPTEANKLTIPGALQSFFYRLQTSSVPISTKELTKSFGWDDYESFLQHDVTELNRVLCDTLESKMKGTSVEGTIERLFRARYMNYIKCLKVDFQSNRPEFYYDLSLNVEGCKNIYESFRQYIATEKLEGDNQYAAEGYGKQDAEMGIRFESFPTIMSLNLKRFKHDYVHDVIKKVNDRYEFYPVIDLKDFVEQKPGQKHVSTVYQLHAVLVHSGTMQGGHYYAYIRPGKGPKWFRFDDETVRKATEYEAIDDNFGAEEDTRYGLKWSQLHRRHANAYMLIYVRDSDAEEILAEVPDEEIPQHLVERLEKEQQEQERRRKEKEEAHLYMNIRLIREEDIIKHDPEKVDLVDINEIETIRFKKSENFLGLKEHISKDTGIPPAKMRFWNWITRQNKTTRPEKAFTPEEEQTELGFFLRDTTSYSRVAPESRFFLEVSKRDEPPYFDKVADADIFFFKYYDLDKNEMRYLGHEIVKQNAVCKDFIPICRKLAKFPSDEPLVLYEEIRPTMIEPLDIEWSLKKAELGCGDIIVCEKAYSEEKRKTLANERVTSWYDFVRNKVTITFKDYANPKEEGFPLVLSKKTFYDRVGSLVGQEINFPGNRLRFYAHSRDQNCPRSKPLKRGENGETTLQTMISSYYDKATEILYYEKLDITVEDMEKLKQLTVLWQNYDGTFGRTISVALPAESTAGDMMEEISKKVELKGTKEVRMFFEFRSKIDKVIDPSECIRSYSDSDYQTLIAEEVPEDARTGEPGREMAMVHYESSMGMASTHGTPFLMFVREGETFGELKKRVRERLNIAEKLFKTWRFAVNVNHRLQKVDDDDLVLKADRKVEYIGMEHAAMETRHHRGGGNAIVFKEEKNDA